MSLSLKTFALIVILSGHLLLTSAEQKCTKDRSLSECGYLGINKEECEDLDCCWDDAEPQGKPWCFNKLTDNQEGEERHGSEHDTCCPGSCRINCGWFGMTEYECLDRGCCWDPLHPSETGPWCYHRNCEGPYANHCDSGALRIDCGHFGISPLECESRNCCWDPLPPRESGPYCFFRNAPADPNDSCCTEETRRECGYCGIKQGECESRGCCWAPTGDDYDTWCFKKNCDAEGDTCDPSAPRKNCGYVGITEEDCVGSGCCWNPLEESSSEPWCYVKNGQTAREVELETREEPPPETVAPAPVSSSEQDELKDKGTSDTGAFLTRPLQYII